jgi:hypothetical protein
MSVERGHRTVLSDRVLAGAALAALGGILAVALGIPGLTMFAVAAVVLAFARPRFALVAGLLTSAGALWTFFGTQAVLRCAAEPSSCSGTSPVPFAAASVLVLGVGLALLAVSRRQVVRSRDKLLSSQAPKD